MDFTLARRTMVDCQILPNNVTDQRIIDAMMELPREMFVPSAKRSVAYVDETLALGFGRFLVEPMVVARLMQMLELKSTDVALAIGAGTGYNIAILGRIVETVVAIEQVSSLAQNASKNLSELGIDNVAIIDGRLAVGAPKQSPYDIIFFDGAISEVPVAISDQLAEEGRLIAMIKKTDGICQAHLMTRNHGVISSRNIFEASTPLLPGFEQTMTFSF
jgi:protein-L-isoaspartate(D-aspartate) O-methyltransferase